MAIEEENIITLAGAAEGSTSIVEIVEILASVMNMVCDLDRDKPGGGTVLRNEHPGAKIVAARLGVLVAPMGVSYESYQKLSDRAEAEADEFGIYSKYEGAMNACNLSGIVLSLNGDMGRIQEAAVAAGEPLAASPIIVCMVDKISQLAGVVNY
jgi:hypothetical protein